MTSNYQYQKHRVANATRHTNTHHTLMTAH